MLYCHQLFILQHHSRLSDLTKGIPHASCTCNDSCDSVMYSCATRTSTTVVSKFPRKTRGAVHAWTVDTRRSSPIFFFECLGMTLVPGVVCVASCVVSCSLHCYRLSLTCRGFQCTPPPLVRQLTSPHLIPWCPGLCYAGSVAALGSSRWYSWCSVLVVAAAVLWYSLCSV